MSEIFCPCGTEIPSARIEALKDTVDVSEIRCVTCAESTVTKTKADFRYDSSGNNSSRNW